jgi:hypothetical protein
MFKLYKTIKKLRKMAYSIAITKRTNGGFTITTETDTFYASSIAYHGTTTGVILYTKALATNLYTPYEWTIQEVNGFTTVVQICDALDNLGITSDDPIIGQAGVENGAGQTTLKTQRVVQAKPDYVDITSDTVIYEGYSNGTNYDICKIDLSTVIITRLWAVGTWANRASLFA